MAKRKSIGLPGGPNEYITDISEFLSIEGYKYYSDDVDNPLNIIESGNITMEDVEFPVYGVDNLGNEQMMMPGMNYEFPGDMVFEVPVAQYGGPLPKAQKGLGRLKPYLRKGVKYLQDLVESSKNFNSQIDWGKWNKAIPGNQKLLQEYHLIEETTKANKTWMKNADGSAFTGTPEQFVQMRSGNFQKAFGNSKLVNSDGSPMIVYHGSGKKFDFFDPKRFGEGDAGYSGVGIYTTPNKTTASSYSLSAGPKPGDIAEANIYELYGNTINPISSSRLIDNVGGDIYPFGKTSGFNKIDESLPLDLFNFNRPGTNFPVHFDAAIKDQTRGIVDKKTMQDAWEIVFPDGKQLKSAVGNSGMFDLTNPNIYKQMGGSKVPLAQKGMGMKSVIPPTSPLPIVPPSANTKKAVILYDAEDPEYFSTDLERMIPSLNKKYGEGNWIAKPTNKVFKPEYKVLQDEINQNEIYQEKDSIDRLYANNAISYDEWRKQTNELEASEGYNDYAILRDRKSDLNEKYKNNKYLSSEEMATMYGSYLKDLDPDGDIIIMQHGDGKIGEIMPSESSRIKYQEEGSNMYAHTPGVVDTFAEVLNQYLPEDNNVTCYMGMCHGTEDAENITRDSGITTKSQLGTWAGWQNRSNFYGDDVTFDEGFFDPNDYSQTGGKYQVSTRNEDGGVDSTQTGTYQPKLWKYFQSIYDVAEDAGRPANNEMDFRLTQEIDRLSGSGLISSPFIDDLEGINLDDNLMDSEKNEAKKKLYNSTVSKYMQNSGDLLGAQTGIEIPKRKGVRINEDGSQSTHLMKAEIVDGKWYGFPSLFQNSDGEWIDMSGEKDWMNIYNEAKKRGELIEFGDDKEAAIAFGLGSWKSKYQEGGGVNEEGVKQYQFLKNYMNSQMYQNRLKNEFPDYTDKQIAAETKTRLENVMQAPVVFLPESSELSESRDDTQGLAFPKFPLDPEYPQYAGKVLFRPEYSALTSENPIWSYNTTPIHEWDHIATDVNNRMGAPIRDLLLSNVKDNDLDLLKENYYYTMPAEVKARLQEFRYLLDDQNIYDTTESDFTQEDLNKARKNTRIRLNARFKDLEEYIKSDEDLIELMNKVAMVNDSEVDGSIMEAQYGLDFSGTDQKDFLKNWLHSPMGQQLLSNSFDGNEKLIEKRTLQRDNLLDNVDIEIGSGKVSGKYNRGPHRIQLDEELLKGPAWGYGFAPKDILLHELSHSQDFDGGVGFGKLNMPLSDQKLIEDLTKNNIKHLKNTTDLSKSDINDLRYVGSPTEVRARLNAIRYGYQTDPIRIEKGLPSIFDSQVTPEMLEIMGSHGQFKNLQEIYSNDEINMLLNTISYQDSDFNQEADKFIYARYGKELPKAQHGSIRSIIKKGGTKMLKYLDNLLGKTDDVVDNVVDIPEDMVVGINGELIPKKRAILLNRIEDANKQGTKGAPYEDGSWFSDQIEEFYVNFTKNATNPDKLLPFNADRRLLTGYVSPEMAEELAVKNSTKWARNVSGGVGNPSRAGEYVLPPKLVQIMRDDGKVYKNAEDLLEAVMNFYNKKYGGDIPKAQRGIVNVFKNMLKEVPKKLDDILQNAYKVNPLAFKPNPKAGYRMIGDDEGLMDILKSGEVRPSPGGIHDNAHFNIGKPLNPNRMSPEELIEAGAPRGYKGPYMAEMTNAQWKSFIDDAPEQMKEALLELSKDKDVWQNPIFGHIKLNDPRLNIYKEHWLKGYEKIPKDQMTRHLKNIFTMAVPVGIYSASEAEEYGIAPVDELQQDGGEQVLTQEDWDKLPIIQMEKDNTNVAIPTIPSRYEIIRKEIMESNEVPGITPDKTSGITPNLLFSQAFVESNLDPSIKNDKGYMGLGQIGQDVIEDYKKANKVSELDPFNPQDNYNVQNWYMNRIYNSEWVDKPNQLDDVRLAKTLAGYSLGPKKARGWFTKFKNAGKDIYNSFDWLDDLPDETSKYIKMILRGENTQRRPHVQENIQDALINDEYKSIRDLYFKRKGGENKIIKMYSDYINGKGGDEQSKKIYDKLNRIYLKDARKEGMSVPNYIMTHLAHDS